MDLMVIAELPGSLSPQRFGEKRGDMRVTEAGRGADAPSPVKKM
jgi:hypothetical protein